MNQSYAEFIAKKTKRFTSSGMDVHSIHESLFDFQSATVRWALSKGKCCLFAGTGLGKTRMQCEFARHIPGKRLIILPLGVAGQTINEVSCLGVKATRIHTSSDVSGDGIYIINYDRMHHVSGIAWDCVVLDESSIIKDSTSATKQMVDAIVRDVPYRMACSATPSPNDFMELGSHAEFVGAMSKLEMLATFFMHDGGDTSKWRLKRHATRDFWTWVASWAACYSSPSDIGFDGSAYVLPPLNIHDHIVDSDVDEFGGLFGGSASATSIHGVLRNSQQYRIAQAIDIVTSQPDRQWLVWCTGNEEQSIITKAIPGAVSVAGADSEANKEDRLLGFSNGKYRTLVTKPSIAGFGMNWQNCHSMVFASIDYSFEKFYQAVRRCYRFGQTMPVDVHIIRSDNEESIRAAVLFKEHAHKSMSSQLSPYSKAEIQQYGN